ARWTRLQRWRTHRREPCRRGHWPRSNVEGPPGPRPMDAATDKSENFSVYISSFNGYKSSHETPPANLRVGMEGHGSRLGRPAGHRPASQRGARGAGELEAADGEDPPRAAREKGRPRLRERGQAL